MERAGRRYLTLTGDGLAEADGARPVGTGTGVAVATLVGTGTGVAVLVLLGTGVAVAVGDRSEAGATDAVGTADGAATAGADAAEAVGVAAGAVAAGVAAGGAETVPVAAGVAGVLAECDGGEALPDVAAAPEQPASASPAATPSPATQSTGPGVTRGVFECGRIYLLLDVVATIASAPGNTAWPLKSCAAAAATFHPVRPYMHKREPPAGRKTRRRKPARKTGPGNRAAALVAGQPFAGHGRSDGTGRPFGGVVGFMVKGRDGAH